MADRMADSMERDGPHEFSVYWLDPEGTSNPEKRFVTAIEAMRCVADLILRPAAVAGIINRVVITDGGDCIVFEWLHGQGVVWPPEQEIEAAGLRPTH